jgi:hypothetical protein
MFFSSLKECVGVDKQRMQSGKRMQSVHSFTSCFSIH